MISAQPTHSASRKPGFRVNSVFLLLIFSLGIDGTLYKEMIYDSVIAEYFGSNGCVEGTLNMAPTVPLVVSSGHIQDHQVSSTNEHELGKGVDDGLDNGMAKEKTPMCLVNELARHNKIEHQYRLTCEEGPPHKKRFTVTLKLGTEEYTADGPSIKKAQHTAAALALKETAYKHPPPKSLRNNRPNKGNITPTVELNALAMKRGEPTVYTVVELPPVAHYNYNYHHHRGMYTQPFNDHYGYSYSANPRGKSFRGVYNYIRGNQRYGTGAGPIKGYKVNVKVGDREFVGEGVTAQAARHDAAARALELLRELPLDQNSHSNHHQSCDGLGEADSASELKSPISLVHEIALKRNLSVNFEVISEKGPPHMRTFVTSCTVGDKFRSNGEGNGKKVSKKRAAEKMLEQLRSLPAMTTVTTGCNLQRMKRKTPQTKKKPRNLIKETNVVLNTQEQKYETENSEEMNPISRLIQIQQAKREKEPVYTLKEERGAPRKREFLIEVAVGDHTFIGSGPNKKLAKRNAAEGLLQMMGYSSSVLGRDGSQMSKGPVQTPSKGLPSSQPGGVAGRQLVPGLLLMTDNKGPSSPQVSKSGVSLKATAEVAKEYLNNQATGGSPDLGERPIRPTEQLRYLSQVLNFNIQYSDFPKGNHHNEFLSLVTLSTDPPQVCHGAGPTTDISKDQAALNALRSLAEMGLDSLTPAKKSEPASNSTITPPSAPNPQSNSTNATTDIYLSLRTPLKDDSYVNGK